MTIPALIADAIVRASPVLGLVLMVCAVRPRSAPAMRHLALAFGLIAFLVMPVATLVLPARVLPFPTWLLPLPDAVMRLSDASAHLANAPVLSASSARSITIATLLTMMWVAGTALLLCRMVGGIVGAWRLRAGSGLVYLSGAAVPRGVSVAMSSVVTVPLVAGVFRPVVLLPAGAASWTAADRSAVLAHEVAHIRRGDQWTLLLGLLVRAMYWPNPLVWMAVRRLRTSSEEACDQTVLARGVPASVYAQLLLRLAREAGCSKRPELAQCLARPGDFGRRIERLLVASPPRASAGRRMLTATVLLVAIGCLGTTRMLPSTAAIAAHYGISEDLARQIMRAALAERLPAMLAFGLVSVESGFDPGRISPGGAIGLTQVLPGTAAGLVPGITDERLRDPHINLRVGFRLLHEYIERFDGDRKRALIAYSSGPAHAGRADATMRSTYPHRVLRAGSATGP